MKRTLAAATSLAAALLVVAPPAQAGLPPPEIQVGDDFYDPRGVSASSDYDFSGNAASWTREPGSEGFHNVREENFLFRSGNPTLGAINFAVTASAGKFIYFCDVHGVADGNDPANMKGKLRVRPDAEFLGTSDERVRIIWGSDDTTTGDEFDVQFRVGLDGRWRDWKDDTSKFQSTFGKRNRPVNVNPNKTYGFRARSGDSQSTRSRWSPALNVGFD